MKLISLMIGLIIVAYLVNKQMTSELSNTERNKKHDKQDNVLPKIPTTPKEVEGFETDMNKLIHDLSSERNKELEKAQ